LDSGRDTVPRLEPRIDILPASELDRLEPLWAQLLAHHVEEAPHLVALGSVCSPADSWRLRKAEYLDWLQAPLTKVLVAVDEDRLLGYAVVRVIDISESHHWLWGDRMGILETLVVDGDARGAGLGRALIEAARDHVADQSGAVMQIAVMAGNGGALRFYQREGALDLIQTLVMPIGRDVAG
jgi:ribosomal protein S18 acetylase RimI-like enzyme